MMETTDEQHQDDDPKLAPIVCPTFEDFDEIVVGKILSFLSSTERRQKRLVCSFWKYMIDHKVGLEVMVNVLNRPLMEFCSKRVLSTIRVKRLTKNGINDNFFPRIKPSSWLLFPHRLRTLIVEQYINLEYLHEILSKCTRLKHVKLALHNLTAISNHELLPQQSNNDTNDWRKQHHPCLKTLQIHHQISTSSVNQNYALTCKMLTLTAPQLENFSLHFHLNHSTMEMDTLINLQMSVIKFCKFHQNLIYVYIDFKGNSTSWTLPQYLVQTYQHRHGFVIEDFVKISKSLSKLQHLVIRLPKTCGFDFWELLCRQQNQLTKLVIQLSDIKLQNLIPIVQQNCKTLTILSLCADSDVTDHTTIDFSILQECPVLKKLHIEVPYREDRSLVAQEIRLSGLPNNLERLDIGWIILQTVDVQAIANLKKLKHLSLVGCGENDPFGVTIPVLCDLLSNRNLEELFIFNINHHYLQFYMRRLVNILNHLQRHNVRVHIRERAFYIISSDTKKNNSSWTWGTVVSQNQNWTRPPAVFINKYTVNDDLRIIV